MESRERKEEMGNDMKRKSRLKKGQLVSFKPRRELLRRDAEIMKIMKHKPWGTTVEISLYASPRELSVKRAQEFL
jgi:hypothetical protein